MKKKLSMLLILCLSFAITACTPKEKPKQVEEPVKQEEVEKNELSREEISQKLKKEATQADFIEINGDNAADKKVFATGKISAVDNEGKVDLFPGFLLTTKEGEGFGIYYVWNVLKIDGLNDGDKVTIYGIVNAERNKSGMPIITATIIEKQ